SQWSKLHGNCVGTVIFGRTPPFPESSSPVRLGNIPGPVLTRRVFSRALGRARPNGFRMVAGSSDPGSGFSVP
ncbi:uncharacterized, partial [Tachysurus ichikawai]